MREKHDYIVIGAVPRFAPVPQHLLASFYDQLDAPVMMMAEKASDMILGRSPLPPDEAPVYETERRRTP